MSASDGEAALALARLDALAAESDEPDRITRLAFSPALQRANEKVLGWMRSAGMNAGLDAAGNVVGRYEGRISGAPAVMLGSHLDTVRDGGRFDGALGVVAAISLVERLAREGRRLASPVEVIGFADEEGVRFGGTLLGSAAVAGCLPAGWEDRRDMEGNLAAKVVRAAGIDPTRVAAASRRTDPPAAYLELHIEQGPVLEAAGIPLGCVTGIAGQTRLMITIEGVAGHAGTVPMGFRHDALVAAAECIRAVERLAPPKRAVATVGHLRVEPDAINVIPGRVTFSVDARSDDDVVRRDLVTSLRDSFAGIAAERALTLDCRLLSETAATPCAPALIEAIGTAITGMGLPLAMIPSGAGHDGIAMSAIAPIGMIFMRCAGGISHHPDENIAIEDLAQGIEALDRACRLVAGE